MRTILRNIKSLLFFPLAIIPIGMFCYGIATILMTPALIGTTFFVEKIPFVLQILRQLGYVIQTQTGLIVAVAITLGLSRKSSVALLITIFVYLVMQVAFNVFSPLILTARVHQDISISPMVVYPFHLMGGLVLAIVVSRFFEKRKTDTTMENLRTYLYNSIWALILGTIAAIVLAIVWVYLIEGLSLIYQYLSGTIGRSIYNFLVTLLSPFGIDVLFDTLQKYTYIGGVWSVPEPINSTVNGYEAIWLAQLQYAAKNFTVGTATSVKYITAMFITPAVSLAIINTAYIEHKQNVRLVMIFFTLVAFITGFTLPIEIILLFTAPLLLLVLALLNGLITLLIYAISNIVNIRLITVMGGGIIDYIFLGVIPGVEKTGAWVLIIIGLIVMVLTYYLFYYLIKQFNLAVFGRNKEELVVLLSEQTQIEEQLSTFSKQENRIRAILAALGGKDNIEHIDASMYRLHVKVKSIDAIQELVIKENGSAGVFIVQSTVQIIFGATTQEYYELLMEEMTENN